MSLKRVFSALGLTTLVTLKTAGWLTPYFSQTPEEYLQKLNFKMPPADKSVDAYVVGRDTFSRMALIGNFHFASLTESFNKTFAGAALFPIPYPINNVQCSIVMPSDDVTALEMISSMSGIPLSLIEKEGPNKNELMALFLVHENDHCNRVPKSFSQYYLVVRDRIKLPFETSANLKSYEFSNLNNLSETYKDFFMASAVSGIFSKEFSHSTALAQYYAEKQQADMIPSAEQTIKIYRQARDILIKKRDASGDRYKDLSSPMKAYAFANEILLEMDKTVDLNVKLVFQLLVEGIEHFCPANAERVRKLIKSDKGTRLAFDM